jgi:allantoinase
LLLPAALAAIGDLMPPERFVKLLAEHPARLVGLGNRKGAIAADREADLVVMDPSAEIMVTPNMLFHRYKATPYMDRPIRGLIERTYLRGRIVFDHTGLVGGRAGHILRRDASANRR